MKGLAGLMCVLYYEYEELCYGVVAVSYASFTSFLLAGNFSCFYVMVYINRWCISYPMIWYAVS